MNVDEDFQQQWHAYYSHKRIGHQWLQVDLLKDLDVKNILEIGPYLGLVTAMLASAGYSVTTLDIDSNSKGIGAKSHINGDISSIQTHKLSGFDAVICCEMLEHIKWQDVDSRMIFTFSETSQWGSTISFFNTDDFQKWSIVNHDVKHGGTWKTYKQPAKDYINMIFDNVISVSYTHLTLPTKA